MTSKANRAQYTLEFKLSGAVGQGWAKHGGGGGDIGCGEQTLNWMKADREGKLTGAGTKPVGPEQMELARLLAEVARMKTEDLKQVVASTHKIQAAFSW
jgi:transposase